MPDKIDEAIEAAEKAPAPPPQKNYQINLTIAGTGRTIAMLVPEDLIIGELLEFLSWAPVGIMSELQKHNNPASRLVIPNMAVPNLLKQKS